MKQSIEFKCSLSELALKLKKYKLRHPSLLSGCMKNSKLKY